MSDKNALFQTDLMELLNAGRFNEINDIILKLNATDIAEFINTLSPKQGAIILSMLPRRLAAETFIYIDSYIRKNLISVLSDQELKIIIRGIIANDIVDIIEKEATEDIEKMAAISPGDKPYLKTGVLETVKSRIPWLVLLMFLATFTGMIITSFEASLAGSIALTAFIPMIMNTGGNSGSQASVAIIRSLALDDVAFKDIGKIIFKEARVSLICGVILAAANFAKIMLFDNLIMQSGVSVAVAAVVCQTLIVTVVAAKIIGCTLPLLAKLCRLDPAVMASPFITTIVDAISLFVYFQIASAVLGL